MLFRSGAHQYQVFAYDGASPFGAGANPVLQLIAGFGQPYGNVSAGSNLAINATLDVTPPTVPANVVAFAPNGSTVVSLSWSPSTDNAFVASYGIYRGGVRVATVNAPATSWTEPAALAAATYVYTVDAVDPAGNRSAVSAGATAILVPDTDTTVPVQPRGLAAANSPDIHGRDVRLTWLATTDNVGVTNYGIFRNGVRIGSVNGATLAYTDVAPGTGTYAYTIDAFDTRGNHSLKSAAVTAVVANDPPPAGHSVLGFFSRDFISALGYPAAAGPYVFSVIRNNVTIAKSIPFNSDATGLIEVNHPGGTCWSGITPDMRAGDVIRLTNAAGIADQTTIMSIGTHHATAINANTVQIRGFALDLAGAALPIAQLEIRTLADKADSLFDLSGARTLRAGLGAPDGTLAADPAGGGKFIATITNLTRNDMFRLCGGVDPAGITWNPAETRVMWLGRTPASLQEQTIFESGPAIAGGPVGGACTAPIETPIAIAQLNTPASLTWGAVGVGGSGAGQRIEFQNTGALTMNIYGFAINGYNPGDFSIAPATFPSTLAPGQKLAIVVTPKPTAVGLRQARVNLLCDAANTTFLAIPVSVTGNLDKAPGLPGAPALSMVQGSTVAVATPATLGAATAQVRLVWAAALAPVTSYELQQSLNGGAWTTVLNATPTTLSTTLTLAMGTAVAPNAYQFRVRAYNNLTVSAFATSMAFDFGPTDETDKTSFALGGTWTTASSGTFYGGTAISASTSLNKVTMSMKKLAVGSGALAIIGTMGPDRGIANVSLDGAPPVAVDFYAAKAQPATLVYVANGTSIGVKHTFTVTPTGTKRAAATGTRIEVDGFLALDQSAVVGPLLNAAPVAASDDEGFAPHPIEFAFRGVTPNPSNRDMTVAFGLPRDGDVQLDVLDVMGRQIRTLQHGRLPAGVHSITWDGRDERGGRAGAGVYFAMLKHEGQIRITRIVRLP